MTHKELYRNLTIQLRARLPQASVSQIRNQALMSLALALSPDSHLATLANQLPIPGQRDNLVQRIRRWLDNQAVVQQRCYRPLVRHLFAHWPDADVSLVMDRTDVEDRCSLLMLSVAFHHRALPLAWQLLPFGASDSESQIALLNEVLPCLPPSHKVRTTLYGDSEFRAVELQRYCQGKGWHWQLGLKSDIMFRQGPDDWQPLRAIALPRGERRYVQGVYLTKKHVFGPVNLIADWTSDEEFPRYLVLDQPADRHAWRRGRKRFWIEPSFRDWKSYGFDLEASKLPAGRRLQALVLAMATTTLWLVHVGQWVISSGRRSLLEAAHKRDYSIFRLGRDYACRSQVMDWPLPVGFTIG